MSVMEKIFSTFGRGGNTGGPVAPIQQVQQPQQQPPVGNNPAQNPPPQGTQQSSGTAPNGVVPKDSNQGTPDPKGDPNQSPLGKFEKLFENEPPSNQDDPSKQQPASPTPQQMMEAAAKVDFSQILDQENLQKIAKGGEDAMAAMAQLLNKTAQNVYGRSIVVTQKLVEKAVSDAENKFAERVPDLVRRHSAKDSLVTENPAFKNPAVSAVVEMVQNQLATKYPNATASEIRSMAQEYFSGAAQILNPPKKSESTGSSSKKSNQDENWDDWFNTPTSST